MKLIGFDIETKGDGEAYGLQPCRVLQGTAQITSAAFVTEAGEELAAMLNPSTSWLRHCLEEVAIEGAVLIGWNTQFDVAWLIACGLETEVRACQWLDGEVLRRAIENSTEEKKSYGLKATVTKYLPDYAGYESEVGGDFNTVNQALLDYNILDAGLTAKLGRIFIDTLDARRQVLSGIICQAIVPVAKAWVEGIPVNLAALNAWEESIKADRSSSLETIAGLTESYSTMDEKVLTSPIKLKTFLCSQGVNVSATNKTILSKFKDNPLVAAIMDFKEANTAKTKFITGLIDATTYNQSDRVHPSCRLWNTYTGRFGYTSKTLKKFPTGIAIHQFPRKTEARNCIIAPNGFLLVECDFATQESRLLCDFSGDETLYTIFTEAKVDFHSFIAARIAGLDYDNFIDRLASGDMEAKDFRQLGKVANLSCAYRTGWKKLIDVARTQFNVNIDDQMAQRLHGTFRDTYKRVPQYWDTAIRAAQSQGYAETRGGRRVGIEDWSRANTWSAESTAINFPIQGTGADMKFLAISQVDNLLYENGGRYMLDLHDALFALVPDTSAGYETAIKMRDILTDLPYKEYYNWSPRVPMPVDLKIGKAWGSLKEIK